jgi:phenylacetate-coenzyme A ligase PaaK-like adenylate-forming protein
LCLANCVDGSVFSTDFFNFDQKFVDYHNGDLGDIGQKKCDCGIYGNFFRYFGGKSMEVIVTEKGSIPGTLIADAIFQASEEIPAFIEKKFRFSILQNKDRSVAFKSDIELNDDHKSTIKNIFNNIDKSILVYFEPIEDVAKTKYLFIKSYAAKEKYS